MKAIILAAGMGTRLGSLIPKPLTPLFNEKTIMDFQVEKLSKFIGVDNIVVVVGYKKELIMEKFPELLYVYNQRYAITNTAKSLLKGLKKMNEDVIWLNGDVFFEEDVLTELFNSQYSAVLVNRERCNNEEVKYNVYEDGFIKEISKEVKDGLGEALGLNLVKQKDLKLFIEELGKVDDQDYFEKAMENLTLKRKALFRPINVNTFFCKEIDFKEDLDEVKKFIKDGYFKRN